MLGSGKYIFWHCQNRRQIIEINGFFVANKYRSRILSIDVIKPVLEKGACKNKKRHGQQKSVVPNNSCKTKKKCGVFIWTLYIMGNIPSWESNPQLSRTDKKNA